MLLGHSHEHYPEPPFPVLTLFPRFGPEIQPHLKSEYHSLVCINKSSPVLE
jgi:hypothetical protein